MRTQTFSDIGVAMFLAMFVVGTLTLSSASHASGQAPDPKVCSDTVKPPTDAITQGGCIAMARTKGNCQACHFVAGAASGNIAPPLVGMAQRFPDRARLRAQIYDPTKNNPKTVMPPYGRHEILTPEEMDKLIAWLLTL